jgi:hypothetical protein
LFEYIVDEVYNVAKLYDPVSIGIAADITATNTECADVNNAVRVTQ